MPKSKRARLVPTSKTHKNRKELVRRLHANIQTAITAHRFIWVFSVQNMRNNALKEVRARLSENSRIFMGKTKLMVHALGATPETEYAPGLRLLTPYLSGEVGLLCTDWEEERVEQFFAGFQVVDFARAGTKAGRGFVVKRGELRVQIDGDNGGDLIPVAVEPTLRKLGVPTRMVAGRVVLEEVGQEEKMMGEDEEEDGYVVCKEGEVLDSRQTTLLKIFGVKMAEFRIGLRAVWEKEGGTVREVGGMEVDAKGDL